MPVKIHAVLVGLMCLLTFGLSLIFWRYRCITCGHSGIKSRVKWRDLWSSKSQEVP